MDHLPCTQPSRNVPSIGTAASSAAESQPSPRLNAAFLLSVICYLIAAVSEARAAVVNEPDPSVEPILPETRCIGNRSFIVEMEYTWSPSFSVGVEQKGPGFVSLLCVAHGPEYSLWSVSKPNSPSLITLLQTKNFSLIDNELRANMSAGNISTFNRSRESVVKSPGQDIVTVTVSPEFNATLISCIAGLTPSPDWFIGVSAVEMCERNTTTGSFTFPKGAKVISLQTYDSEFNDQETPLGESIPVSPVRPVRQRVGLGPFLGSARIAVPQPYVAPSQTAKGDAASRKPVECFPGSATVERADGQRVQMRDLQESQSICTGRDSYSEVFMFSHRDPHVWAEFVTLRFEDRTANRSGMLTASGGHYVYVYDVESYMTPSAVAQLRAMDTVREGDRLVGRDGSPLSVVHIYCTWGQGLYNPHTINGDMVVDGVRVSSFTRAIDPVTAEMAIRPLRLLYAYGWKQAVHHITRIALSGRFNTMLAKLLPSGMSSR